MATTSTATTAVPAIVATEKAPDGECKMVKERSNINASSLQKQYVLSPKKQRQPQERPKEAHDQAIPGKQEKQLQKQEDEAQKR